ncbi:DUF1598 domain-containing protein [Bythopirellula goksoeyrii]|uniref:DUF1598 domain-containing protein n=1 Tax=Bythopirellula goksoeyrii TaxID=1400387 RepID=A0A5B9Q937_9BACT|nr:DUF1598 domain-containing protein [Bythopirellula goksoeyrii]QEG34085.1 hypothetical protein Pr1d_13570 [Bythopirellula goksoeyrii]
MNRFSTRYRCPVFVLALGLAWSLATAELSAQFVQQAIGGIAVDAEGVVQAPTVEDEAALAKMRESALAEVPEDLQAFTDVRAVSLKQLEAEVAKHLAEGSELPESVRYLAGLQRVKYVFVYPEQNDVVIAGPAEGWRVDRLGNVVGATTGRPVLLLEDLVVALRTRDVEQLEAISCSIDPTPAGMQRLRGVMRRIQSMGDPEQTMTTMEEALGPQVVTVTGVPQSSHFARTMVAADFRMKRLAMGFDASPVGDMPSFMEMLASSRGSTSATPRWWLAPKYEPLAKDAAGLAWELRGQGVQCLTEEDHFNAAGIRQSSSKAGAAATAWANKFTERFNELADHDSSFGSLRNAMDLAVVAALIDKQGLLDKAGLTLPELTHALALSEYYAPRQVNSQANFVRRRNDFVVSASGGVQLIPWTVADEIEEVAAVGDVRAKLAAPSGNWTWQ